MKVSVYRKATFNAAHRLYNKSWAEEKNAEVFGKCANPNFHGHNYTVVVKLKGELNQETGYVFDLKLLKQIIEDNIINRFDHRNLNLDIPEFQNLNPTAENIAVVIWNILREKIGLKFELSIILYETERNFVEYTGE